MIVAMPAETPVMVPVAGLMDAVPGLELLQLPAKVVSPKTELSPTHTDNVPVMDAGSGKTFTVPESETEHPALDTAV